MSAPTTLVRPHLRDLGGLVVRRLLPSQPVRAVGPFVFFDHFGPVAFAPGQGIDVRPHPHIGLATVTFLFDGALMHRDSLGSVQRITPGAVNWMTAGRGIVHSERTGPGDRAAGHTMHGLQMWVALPREHEPSAPGFVHVPAARLPTVEVSGAHATVVAGSAFGATSPAPTLVETLCVSVKLPAGAAIDVPAEHAQRAVYAVSGELRVDGADLPGQHLAVLPPAGTVRLVARTDARAMLVGGAPLDGERIVWWNFVASSRERIEAAKEDWRAMRFGTVPGDAEFIPLPEPPPAQASIAPEPGAGSVP